MPTTPNAPNHALQRTRAAVTPAASGLRLAPATQRSRQPRGSLSLRSLGVTLRLGYERRVFPSTPSMTRHLLRAEFLAVSPAGQAGPRRSRAVSSGFGGASASHGFGVPFACVSTQNVTPNHALQPTAPRVTVAAILRSYPSRACHIFS